MKRLALMLGALLCAVFTHAQTEYQYGQTHLDQPTWVQMMYSGNADYEAVAEAYEAYYDQHPFQKNQHTQYYKRWMRAISRDVDGVDFWTLSQHERDLRLLQREAYLQRSAAVRNQRGAPGNWVPIGPFDFDKEAASTSYACGAAHCYAVEQSMSNPNVLYAGTATAGLWKSTDKGMNWTPLTSDMMVTESTALEIDFTDENVAYAEVLGGVYKTTDGGQTWSETGVGGPFASVSQNVADIVSHPQSNQTLFVATQTGLYRTTDGGTTYSTIVSGDIQEVEVHPTNNSIWYAVRESNNATQFLKSTDNGNTFQVITAGWPSPTGSEEQRRTEISVSAAAPNKVFALATGVANGGSGLYGIYVSDDEGDTWTFTCCGPQPAGAPNAATNMNLMGWADDGSDDGGQYYYDLAMDVSPTNADSVFVAGVNLWVSADGGQSWTCPSKWSHSDKVNYVHADIHDIRFYGNDLWVACDGGIFYSDDRGDNFNRRQYGITGTDFWGFGAGFWDGEVMLGGTYHNGTLLKNEDVYINDWLSTDGGDNYRGFVNPGREKVAYSDYDRKELVSDRTEEIRTSGYDMKPFATYLIGESSEIEFDPRCYDHWYSGVDKILYKTEDGGSSFTAVHDFFPANVRQIEVSWSNPDVLYVVVAHGTLRKLWTSSDAGATWTEITPTSTTLGGNTTRGFDIAVDHEDENTLWMARVPSSTSNNFNGYQVFKTTDGGQTWSNITTAMLDGEYITNIEHQRGTDGGVWLGTRRAVYYRNNTMPDWELYNADLPVTTTSINVELHYRSATVINGSSRSVYAAPFFEVGVPSAQISVDKMKSFCLRDSFYFADHSALNEAQATWQWSFPGGSPATSTDRKPVVVYSAPGTYSVTLTVTDSLGTDTQTLTDFITVIDGCSADTVPGYAMEAQASGDYARIPSLDMETNVISMSAWIKPDGAQDDYTGIVFSNGQSAGMNFRPNGQLGYHWPGGSWSWNSGLDIPIDEWSHVALVATADSIRLYVNGVGSTHVTALDSVDWRNETLIGSYKGWGSRNFRGIIDEVCIWDYALTQDEVRASRHLTKVPADNAGLLVYYQFNESEGPVLDRVGNRHGSLAGAAVRTISTGPFGGGESMSQDVVAQGMYSFAGTDAEVEFTGNVPGGEVWMSRINAMPDEYPLNSTTASRSYWIINNYGNVENFDPLSEILFQNCGDVSAADVSNPSTFKLYTRDENADGPTWNLSDNAAEAAVDGPDGDVNFNSGVGVTSDGQLIIINEGGSSFQGTPSDIEEPVQPDFFVYPNPIRAGATLQLANLNGGEMQFELYDARGRKVLDTNVTGRTQVETQNWDAGIYIYRVFTEDKLYFGKVIIE